MENLIFGLSVSNYGIHCKRILNLRVEVASKDSLQAQFLTITNLCILQPFIDALSFFYAHPFSSSLFPLFSSYCLPYIFTARLFLDTWHFYCIILYSYQNTHAKSLLNLSILIILFMLPAFSVCTLLSTYITI